ncbi:MAG: hypothetical protein ACFFDI_23485 [Promethearchaeota archaeon]
MISSIFLFFRYDNIQKKFVFFIFRITFLQDIFLGGGSRYFFDHKLLNKAKLVIYPPLRDLEKGIADKEHRLRGDPMMTGLLIRQRQSLNKAESRN